MAYVSVGLCMLGPGWLTKLNYDMCEKKKRPGGKKKKRKKRKEKDQQKVWNILELAVTQDQLKITD